jgi:flagellar basal-body rod protein FlgG
LDKGIYTALSGSIVQERRMDIISNNLANVNSAGYKGDIPVFESYLQQQKGVNIPAPITPNEYVVNSNPYIDFSQGPLHETANELDLALNGDGFFAVDTPDGVRYTRNGNFKINAEGLLTTQDGYPVLGKGKDLGDKHIYINVLSLSQQGEVSVSADGTISVIDRFSGDVPVLMREGYELKIVDFEKPYALRKAGNGMYAPISEGIAELKAKNTEVKQGFIERSNINTIKEMTSMIEVVRGYESYQKVIQSFSESTSKLVDEVGRAA